MADIPFSIGGHQIHCPNFDKSKFDPANMEYQYLNGSLVHIGGPVWTYLWDYLPDDEVAVIRALYKDLVDSVDPTTGSGTPINVTIPDFKAGGLRMTTAYITEPTGSAGGDGSKGFSLIVYNLHESSFQAAIASPMGNLWEVANNGGNIEIGSSNYRPTGWQF
jgi:hypothetical protein